MNSRSPRRFSPEITREEPFLVNTEGGATPNVPIGAVVAGRAFVSNGRGGLTLHTGTELSDDPVWEENGTGGVQLKLS